MGDMILSLPVIKAIKIKNPIFKIYVLASNRNAKVLENLSYIDKIIIIDINLKIKKIFNKVINNKKIKIRFFYKPFTNFFKLFFLFFFQLQKAKQH